MQVEPLESPVWRRRVQRLVILLHARHETADLIRRARLIYGWSGPLTRHVLAAGEGAELAYDAGAWRRS